MQENSGFLALVNVFGNSLGISRRDGMLDVTQRVSARAPCQVRKFLTH